MSAAQNKLIECREMIFAAAQSLYVIVGVLHDKGATKTADAIGDLASMLNDFSISIDGVVGEQGE